jgi:uncharacterized protein (DUF3084 family)
MSSGYILIVAVLILGGIIATLGDRIGTRVGKARLSLFSLRPKNTAVLVTIITGIIISATTLGILLAASSQFRDMLLNFEVIQRRLKRTRGDLDTTRTELEKSNTEKEQVEQALRSARSQRTQIERQLVQLRRSLGNAMERQRQTEALRLQAEQQRNLIQSQLLRVSQQAASLRTDINRLRREQQVLVAQRDQIAAQIAARDRAIRARNQLIAQREKRLQDLEQQQVYLQTEIEQLARLAQQSNEQLRLGVPVLVRNQPLAFGVIQANTPLEARQAVDSLLNQANRFAFQRIQPGGQPEVPLIQIERSEVERLLQLIADGQPYVVRVLSAANYLLGESFPANRGVAVFMDVSSNRVIFNAGDVVVSKFLDNPARLSSEQLQDWMTQLINNANFRARQRGLLAETTNVRLQAVLQVVEVLRQYDQPIEVRIVTADKTYTSGPMQLEFIVIKGREVILRT